MMIVPLIVPREIDGYNITQIGAGAFSGNEELTSIELLSNIKTIGTGAFSGCTNLKNVKLPNGLEVIENSAFMNCTSLKSINIPNTVTSLGAGFLYNATNMEDIYLNWTTLSDGLVYVSTFGGINKSIADIHVPTGLIETYSNNFAFTGFNIV